MRFRAGAAVILEGLDKAGKTTQRNALTKVQWEGEGPLITHMPSGVSQLTQLLYEVTERQEIKSNLARQLLHLACHAENLPALKAARMERGVVVDRWWWSTAAYGWFGGIRREVSESAFFGTIEMVWSGFTADLVFLFSTPFQEDSHNLSSVADGYRVLAGRSRDVCVEVPRLSETATTEFILEKLDERGLLVR
jgi:dTMP kinase